jgi:23S rRNA pseudouridine2605 synthase
VTVKSGTVALNRALSKLGILSRAQATDAVRSGRVRINGRVVTDPRLPVVPERVRIAVDEAPRARVRWRTILFHKPRGVVTTRSDPEGRRTVYDVLGDVSLGLVTVGRLDLATSGLLLLTTDTRLANWITDPARAVPRIYVVTVRGRVGDTEVARLTAGVDDGRSPLQAHAATVLKVSSRESHLLVELREGKNREIRRLFGAIEHEATRIKRVRLGSLELKDLQPGEWRDISWTEIAEAFPGAPLGGAGAKIRAPRRRTVQDAELP